MNRRLYRCLLHLLPQDFRSANGSEMEEAFLESLELTRPRRSFAWIRAISDVLGLAVRLRYRSLRRGTSLRRAPLDGIAHALEITLRRLRKAPSFTIACTLTLALGIGATVLMLTLVDAVLIRPLPYPDSDRLVALFLREETHDLRRAPTSPVNRPRIVVPRPRRPRGNLPPRAPRRPPRPAHRAPPRLSRLC